MPKPDQCDTCAFKEGSVTFHEPYNQLRGVICAMAGIPFFCHHGLNYGRHLGIHKGIAFDLDGNSARAHVCAGWRAEAQRLTEAGQYDTDASTRQIQKRLGNRALELVDAFIEADEGPDKEDKRAELWLAIRMLAQRACLENKSEVTP